MPQLFYLRMTQVYLLPAIALALSLTLHGIARNTFPRWGLLDFPERYGLRRVRLPYPTGVVTSSLLLAFVLGMALRGGKANLQDAGIAFGVALIALVSAADDLKRVSPYLRFVLQCTIALVIFLTGTRIFSITNPLGGVLPLDTYVIQSQVWSNPSVIGALFTIAWLVLTCNALNWFDGVRGQSSLSAVLAFIVLGVLSLSDRVGDTHLGTLALTFAAIALGSLAWERGKLPNVIGDSGTMTYGLLLGILTTYAGGKVATGFLVLGAPIVDAMIVTVRRIVRGRSPFKGSAQGDHLHHLLLERGWNDTQILVLMGVIGSAFGVTALFLTTAGKAIAVVCLMLVMIALHWWARRK